MRFRDLPNDARFTFAADRSVFVKDGPNRAHDAHSGEPFIVDPDARVGLERSEKG